MTRPAAGMSRIDGACGVFPQPHSDSAQLAKDLRESLLCAATEIVEAVSELPDEPVDHEPVGRGVSRELDLDAVTGHLTAAGQALSAAAAALRVAGFPVGGVLPCRRG